MDKFMIDPKEPAIINKEKPVIPQEPVIDQDEEPIVGQDDKSIIDQEEGVVDQDEGVVDQEEGEPIIKEGEPIIKDGEPVKQGRSYIIIIIGLVIFVGYSIYYSFKYKENEKNYLIKSNAYTFKDTLDGMKRDVKSYLKDKAEQYEDWKDYFKSGINKYFFNKHVDNGVFRATKYKATNLLN